MSRKFPVRIVNAGGARGNSFTTSIAKLAEGSGRLRKDLNYLEADFSALIAAVKQCVARASPGRAVDPRLMWLAADHIQQFLVRLDDAGFYLQSPSEALATHLGMAAGTIRKLLAFRRRFPRLHMVDPTVAWSKYRENKTPKPPSAPGVARC